MNNYLGLGLLVASLVTFFPLSSYAQEATEGSAGEQSQAEKKEESSTNAKLTLDDLKDVDPTNCYYKIHKHIMSSETFDDVKPFLTEESRNKSTPSTGNRSKVDPKVREAQMFKFMKALISPTVKVTKQEINGKEAVLTAIPLSRSEIGKQFESMADSMADSIGKAFSGGKAPKPKKTKRVTTGKIVMKMEDGIWKLHKESWHTKGAGTKVSKAKQQANSWCQGTKSAQFARKPVAGKIFGRKFVVFKAEYNKTVNTLDLVGAGGTRWNKPSVLLFLFNKGKLPLGQTFQTKAGDTFGAPHVHVRYLKGTNLDTKTFTGSDHYGLRLQFNRQLTDGKLTGYIVLRLPDKSKSEINGYFHATVK